MQYTDRLLEHFMNPHNVGEIPDANGVGELGSEECGDMIKVWISVADDHLIDIKYKVFGCPAAIASCSMMTELAIGKHVDDAWKLTDDNVAEALGGLPAQKQHCSNLAASALHRAIMNYVMNVPSQQYAAVVTVLVDDTAGDNLHSEHGLSFWIECGDERIVFDTGQSALVATNAKLLGVDLARTSAIVLSHGHYDHTGGLEHVLDIARQATVYLHPAASEPKFSSSGEAIRHIGMPNSAKEALQSRAKEGKVVWTEKPTEVAPGLFSTGEIPRRTGFEGVNGTFFVLRRSQEVDILPDDQAVFFNCPDGLVILLGCAHSGVVNTLNYIAQLSGQKHIYAVIGGMHLLNASSERVTATIEALQRYRVQRVVPTHCTGAEAVAAIQKVFAEKCSEPKAGLRIEL